MKLWKSVVVVLLFAGLVRASMVAKLSRNLQQTIRASITLVSRFRIKRYKIKRFRIKQRTDQPRRRGRPPRRPTPETIVSSKEAKELFRSVDEILQFASQDTGLPIKHKVKRKLTKRDEVQSYLEKSMKDDKDAKRLERSSAVLKKFGLMPRNFDLVQLSGRHAARAGGGILRR